MPQKALLMGHSLTHAVKYIKFTIYSIRAGVFLCLDFGVARLWDSGSGVLPAPRRGESFFQEKQLASLRHLFPCRKTPPTPWPAPSHVGFSGTKKGLPQGALVRTLILISGFCYRWICWYSPESLVARLTTTMAMKAATKPGMISYTPGPPMKLPFQPREIQIITVAAPTTIPAMAPAPLVRDHIRDSRISGPKAAPKPAQALLTRARTWEFGSEAMTAATRPTATTQARPTFTHSLSVASLRRNRR